MSIYLIDGYNLLHQILEGRDAGDRRGRGSKGARGRGHGRWAGPGAAGRQSAGRGVPNGAGRWEGPSGPGPTGSGLHGAVDLEDERRRLLDRIASYMGGTSDRAIVVFDSRSQVLQKSESATPQVDVYFGSFSQSADSIIEREVYALSPGESVVVVSSDYQLQKTVFLANVVRRSSRQFAADLQANTRRIANLGNCITINHRIEERIPRNTLERLARLRDELEQEPAGEGEPPG